MPGRTPVMRLARAAAEQGAGPIPRSLRHPVVLGIDCPEGAGLLDPVVTLRWELHPALARWLRDAGWVVDAGRAWAAGRSQRAAGEEILASVGTGTPGHGLRLECHEGTVNARGPRLPGSLRAAEAIQEANARSWALVVEGSAWLSLRGRQQRALVAFVQPADPHLARLWLPGQEARDLTGPAALAEAERGAGQDLVAVDSTTVDLAAMTLAAAAERDDLTAGQDDAVSRMLATGIGAVLAYPPGSGKTVMAASMLKERDGRALVSGPVAVLEQWMLELSRFTPGRAARLASDVAQVDAALAQEGAVVVCSWDTAAAWAAQAGPLRVDDLIVDEAVALLGRSKRASGLWALRQRARRAYALTGTPSERHGTADVAALAAWARGISPGVVTPREACAMHPVILLPGDPVPQVPVHVSLLPVLPSAEDHAWLDQEIRRAAGTPARGLEGSRAAERLRRALGDPAAAGDPGRASAKRDALVDALIRHPDQTLLCTASLPLAQSISHALGSRGHAAGLLDSSLSGGARARLLAAFAAGDVRHLSVTPAGQRGVNLQAASLVAHLDLPATPALLAQRNARAGRMGSRHANVTCLVPYWQGTVDEAWTSRLTQADPAGSRDLDPRDLL